MIIEKHAHRELCWELPLDVGTGINPPAQLACVVGTHWMCILCYDSPGSSRLKDDFQHLLEIHSGILFSKNVF